MLRSTLLRVATARRAPAPSTLSPSTLSSSAIVASPSTPPPPPPPSSSSTSTTTTTMTATTFSSVGGACSLLRPPTALRAAVTRRATALAPPLHSHAAAAFAAAAAAAAAATTNTRSSVGVVPRRAMGWFARSSENVDNAGVIYSNLAAQVARPELVAFVERKDNFDLWFRLVCLHVWMHYVALRVDTRDGEDIAQHVFNHFWLDAEHKMLEAGVHSWTLSKFQKQYLSIYNAIMLSYDEGLVGSDQQLAEALWRSLWNFDAARPLQLAVLVAYVRRELHCLDRLARASTADGFVDTAATAAATDADADADATADAVPIVVPVGQRLQDGAFEWGAFDPAELLASGAPGAVHAATADAAARAAANAAAANVVVAGSQ